MDIVGAQTVGYCLGRYGARVTLNDCLEILSISESTFYAGIRAGKYPQSLHRGLWSTEQIAMAAAGQFEPHRQTEGAHEDSDGL